MLRHPPAGRPRGRQPAPRADLHPGPRPTSASTTRTSRTRRSSRSLGAERAEELRRLTLEVYDRAEGIARERGIILADTKLEFGGARGRHDGARRRGADPRLVALLAGGRVAARPHAAVVRQADRAQLGALPGVRLGPRLRRGPAAAAARGGRSGPGRGTSRPTSCSPARVPMRPFGGGPLRVCRATAFDYLVDPRHRAGVAVLAGAGLRGGRRAAGRPDLVDETKPGLKPRMRTTELTARALERVRHLAVRPRRPDPRPRRDTGRLLGRLPVPRPRARAARAGGERSRTPRSAADLRGAAWSLSSRS